MTTKAPPSKSLGTVLVIGGCGFLGSNVVDQLLNFPSEDNSDDLEYRPQPNGTLSTSLPQPAIDLHFPSLRSRYPSYTDTTVHALDLKCARNRHPGCSYHEADITSASALLSIFKQVQPDVVINTASPPFNAPHGVLRRVNIVGTRTLLDVASGVHGSWGHKCSAFVHTSSASVIHDTVSDLINADERWPYVCPNPREYYSETKVLAEQMVLEANRQHDGMLTCAIRPAGIVGENDAVGFSHGVLTTAAIAPDWQLHFQLGAGANLFDNTYVGNVVYAHLLAAEGLLATASRLTARKTEILDSERIDGEAFIVTNDQPGYFWDTCRFLWTCYGRQVNTDRVLVLPEGLAAFVGAAAEITNWLLRRKGKLDRQSVKYACMNRYYSCGKIKKRLRYRPLVGIEEALGRSVRSFQRNEREGREGWGGAEKGKEKKVQ